MPRFGACSDKIFSGALVTGEGRAEKGGEVNLARRQYWKIHTFRRRIWAGLRIDKARENLTRIWRLTGHTWSDVKSIQLPAVLPVILRGFHMTLPRAKGSIYSKKSSVDISSEQQHRYFIFSRLENASESCTNSLMPNGCIHLCKFGFKTKSKLSHRKKL